MGDARWLDVANAAQDAAEHFRNAVALHAEGGFNAPGLDGYKAIMAFMHSVQSGHTSLESALCRVLDILGEERPTGDSWHDDLIRRASQARPGLRPPILGKGMAARADETRKFRHLATRSYGRFRASEAKATVAAARALARGLIGELDRFRQLIDPPEAAGTRKRRRP
jgi:hypothetical protein